MICPRCSARGVPRAPTRRHGPDRQLARRNPVLAGATRAMPAQPVLCPRNPVLCLRDRHRGTARACHDVPMDTPMVLFVCVHNAGRSQMAAGYLRHLAGDRIRVRSAGSAPGDRLNPVAVAAMREEGIDITAQQPRVLADDDVQQADVVITMGCGDACPYYPGKRYEDWELDDPAGQPLATVRQIRDDIKARVNELVAQLTPAGP